MRLLKEPQENDNVDGYAQGKPLYVLEDYFWFSTDKNQFGFVLRGGGGIRWLKWQQRWFGFYLGFELCYFIVQIYYFNVLYDKIKVRMLGIIKWNDIINKVVFLRWYDGILFRNRMQMLLLKRFSIQKVRITHLDFHQKVGIIPFKKQGSSHLDLPLDSRDHPI